MVGLFKKNDENQYFLFLKGLTSKPGCSGHELVKGAKVKSGRYFMEKYQSEHYLQLSFKYFVKPFSF